MIWSLGYDSNEDYEPHMLVHNKFSHRVCHTLHLTDPMHQGPQQCSKIFIHKIYASLMACHTRDKSLRDTANHIPSPYVPLMTPMRKGLCPS